MSEIDKAVAVGHIPSGLFIICAGDRRADVFDGYLASWVQQASFKPLLITFAVKKGRPAYDLIKNGMTFTVNIVGEHERGYLKHFWSGYDPEKNPFSEIPHRISENGGIIFEQAKSTIECKMIDSHEPGDHEIIVAEVLESYVLNEETKPHVHIRKSGKDY